MASYDRLRDPATYAMSVKDQKTLEDLRSVIESEIQLAPVLDHLKAKGHITDELYADLNQLDPQMAKSRFVTVLQRKGLYAFESFCAALKSSRQYELLEKLQSTSMSVGDRKILEDLRSQIESEIQLAPVLDYLKAKGIFTTEQITSLQQSDPRLAAGEFLTTLQLRGPKAFESFCAALEQSAQIELLKRLKPEWGSGDHS